MAAVLFISKKTTMEGLITSKQGQKAITIVSVLRHKPENSCRNVPHIRELPCIVSYGPIEKQDAKDTTIEVNDFFTGFHSSYMSMAECVSNGVMSYGSTYLSILIMLMLYLQHWTLPGSELHWMIVVGDAAACFLQIGSLVQSSWHMHHQSSMS